MKAKPGDRAAAFRIAAPLALILVLLSALLIALRIEQVMLEFAQGRSLRTAQQISDQVAAGYRLGLGLQDQTQLPQALSRQAAQNKDLVGGWIVTDAGEIAADMKRADYGKAIKPVWTAQLLGTENYAESPVNTLVRHDGQQAYVGTALFDASGRRAGLLWLVYDFRPLREAAWSVLRPLGPYALAVGATLALLLGTLATWWMRLTRSRLEQAQTAFAHPPHGEATPSRDPTDAVPRSRRGALLLLAATVSTFIALTLLAWQGRDIARPLLMEQIDRNARSVLRMAQDQVQRALSLGIPADKLVGVEGMLKAELDTAPEVAFLAWQTAQGAHPALASQSEADPQAARAALVGSGQAQASAAFRLVQQAVEARQGADSGLLSSGTSSRYIDARMRSVLVDLVFAIVVGLVLVRELLGAAWQRSALKPYLDFSQLWPTWRRQARQLCGLAEAASDGGRARLQAWSEGVRRSLDQLLAQAAALLRGERPSARAMALTRIRLLVFLTALSDELLRPFFTVFASEMQPLWFPLSPTTLAVLPVATFMLTLTLAQPVGPWLTRKVSMRWALCATALTGAALLMLTARASSAGELMALRAGSGMVYGLLLILAQTAIIRLTDASSRARGLVEVAAAIVAAGVCGPALGGLLVERLGTTLAFAAGALCLGAAALMSLSLPALPSEASGNLPPLGWRGMLAVLRNRQVMAVTWFAAVPARLAAVALLVVVTPLYLQAAGESATISGRVLLGYFLAFMLTAPWVARWSDMSGRRQPWVFWGCVLSAVACGLLVLVGGVWGAALCCALLGVAQALQSAPQLALVTEAFHEPDHDAPALTATPTQALAAFRFIERFGSVLAPFVVALAVAQLGMTGAVLVVGVLLAVGAAGLMWSLRASRDGGVRHAMA